MSASRAQPMKQPRDQELYQKAQKIKSQIDQLITKMNQNQKFMPTRDTLESYAQALIQFINTYHDRVVNYQAPLKAAIIDLTEVPEMAPQMQRISFQTALIDASAELQRFLGWC